MASLSISRYFTALSFLILYFRTLTADPSLSFYFKNFGKGSNFESQIALYGDTKVINDGFSVQIGGSSVSSGGRVMYKKPIKLVEGNPRKLVSFSTYFSFSISPENGDGLAFLIVPIGFPLKVFDGGSFGLLDERKFKLLGVEFDSLKDTKYGFDSIVSVKLSNVSSINYMLNSGEKLQAWIDYQAGSKRLEVRLSKLGDPRPFDSLLSYPIDLSQIWKEGEVLVGLSSSSGNSSQKCNLYSWSFKLRRVPHSMHSEPLDPEAFVEKKDALTVHKRSDCILRFLGALIFGAGCGALGAFIVLFVWTIVGNRRPVVPEGYAVQPVEFEFKKFKVVVDKAFEDGKK